MLERLTIDDFSGRVGERFSIRPTSEHALPVELVEARQLGPARPSSEGSGARRAPFALLFRGPVGTVLPQRIYRVEHDAMGSYELFLVPVGPGHGGMLYEAIFT
jgi:hypothetical protein